MLSLKTLAAVLSLLGYEVDSVSRQDLQDCHQAEHERRIEACTRIAENQFAPRATRAYTLSERGLAREARHDVEGALKDYSEAIRIAPGYAWSYSNRGRLYQNASSFEQSIADFSAAIRLEPTEALHFGRRGLS